MDSSKKLSRRWLLGAAALPLAWHLVVGFGTGPVAAQAPAVPVTVRASIRPNPTRDAFFGDLHLHTTSSYDAYLIMGTQVNPDQAYKFARGDYIDYLGGKVRREEPLDFLAVTDHSENLGVFNQLDDPHSELSLTEIGKLAKQGGYASFVKILRQLGAAADLGPHAREVSASAWQRAIDAANSNYQPGKFTTFIAYEWTSMPGDQNLHRNVIFRGDKAPSPFTKFDSEDPKDLWTWLGKIRGQGYEALAIPHNGNASNGLMYDWNQRNGRPIDEAWAQLRATNEPLTEVSQSKGSSETHPALSPNDEFANFEIWNKLLIGDVESKKPGSYWRDALGRGLVIGARIGINPYKDGAVAAGDLHSGLSVSSENDFAGNTNIGPGRKGKTEIAQILGLTNGGNGGRAQPATVTGTPGLTGVWAEANTREAIYAALRRKETFATSGTRLKLRFFGGWGLPRGLLRQRDWVAAAYARGVPMGSDLPVAAAAHAPSFAIQAVKDPHGGNLDRVQVVKVWLDSGKQQERVFDVAWSGLRRPDPKTGKLPAVGNTVDLATGKYTNTIGAAQLTTVWIDPSFRKDQPAVYYVRALEIPTPRWTTLRAVEFGLPLPTNSPPTLQERAWSSPIWYTPAKS